MEMWIFLAVVLGAAGFLLFLHYRQWLDRGRVVYTLTFPAELDPKLVIGWLQAVSGTLGQRSIVLETIVTANGLIYRIRANWQQAEAVAAQLQGLIPGIRCTPDDKFLRTEWTATSEWGESRPERPLRIDDPGIIATTIISTLQPLEDDEALVFQWVLRPSKERDVPPYEKVEYSTTAARLILGGTGKSKEAVDEYRAKLTEVNFDAVLRIATYAKTQPRAKYLLNRVGGAVRSVRGQSNRIRQRLVLYTSAMSNRVTRARSPIIWPARMTAKELVALISWPIGSMDVAGLPQSRTRHMSASNAIPREGIVIGRSTLPGHRPVALTQQSLMTHAWIAGRTGVGKSTLLENIAAQLMQEGAGLVMVEPSGDLTRKVLDLVPRGRVNDVIYIDPTDTDNPVGLNLMQGASPSMVTSYLSGVLEAAFGTGIQTSDILRNTIYTVAQYPDLTLYEVALALDDAEFRDDITRGIEDEQLKRFWTRYEGLSRAEQAQTTEPVMRRLRALLVPELSGIFGQAKGLDMRQVLADGKVVVVNLAEGQIGESNAELLGSLVVARLWQEVQARSFLPESTRTPFFLIADEFQRYVRLPTSFSEILAQARKYGLGCLLAHQHLGQIGKLKDDVLTNTATKIVLGTAANDAAAIAKDLGLKPEDIQNLSRFEAIVRMIVNNALVRPATIETLQPPKPKNTARAVREASKRLYGKPRVEVEAEFKTRREARRRPPKGRAKLGDATI